MPLEYIVIPLAALGAAVVTFLSGFGLGTLLMPVFALFFPVPVAIAITAVVHFLNNFFEMAFLYRHVDVKIALSFGIPAAASAYGGAKLLGFLSGVNPLGSYFLFGVHAEVTAVKLTVAVLILIFAAFEAVPHLRNISFDRRYVPLGGILSGFFGGLSGHQGAPRAAFLIRTGLPKESYIATGVAAAILIDMSRISVYSGHFIVAGPGGHLKLLIVACAGALIGTAIGSRVIGKVTYRIVKVIVSVLLVIVAAGLGAGLL
jgi:uncharacterized protein